MIELNNITKNYGRTVALRDFSIVIEQPSIYCLLGRNGAGKTTLMKLLAGHIAATSGEVSVNGKSVSTLSMPEEVHFVESGAAQFNVRLEELFRYAHAINFGFDRSFALEMAKRFKLDLNKRYAQLSFGMKAMVNTLIAMSSGRDVLLLDEPVLGFDPVMRRTFYTLLAESQSEKPKTVIVSTHIIDEIEKAAERLIIIDKGRLVLSASIDELDDKAYAVIGQAEYVKAATEGLHIIGETTAGGFLSQSIYDKRIDGNDRYSIASLSLQDFFIGLVGNDGEGM